MAASTTETLLLQVDIQANNTRLVELQKQLLDNKAALAELNKAFKDNKISADELAAGQVRLGQNTKQVQQEVGILSKANEAQAKANTAATGSIEQLRAQLALGTSEYNKLTASERDNTEAGQKLQANNKALSDQLKTLEKAVGDTRRSVGDYNTGVKDVNVVNDKLKGGFGTIIDKGLAPFRGELDKATGLLGKFKSGNELVKDGLSSLKGAGEAGSLGFKAVASGIALTGIGLFVIAISAVVSYFTQTAEGGKILKGVLGGLGTAFQVVQDTVSGFGKAIVLAVTNPKEALKDLVQVLEDQVVNRFKSFALIFDAIRKGDVKQIANGFLQLGTGVEDVVGKATKLGQKLKDAYDLGADFAAREKDLAKSRRELEKDDAQAESRVNVLLRLSKERGKNASDQLASLQQAGKIEAELSEARISQSQKELKLIDDRIKAKGAAAKGELIQDKQAKELEIIQAESAQKETNAKIQVRESVFREQQRKAAAEAAQKAREDAVRAKITEQEELLLQVDKGSAAELAVRQRLIQLAADLEIASSKKTAEERKLIQAKANADIDKLGEDFAKSQAEKARKRLEDSQREVLREYSEAQKNLNDYLASKQAQVESDYAKGLISENEYQAKLNAIEKAGNDAALVNAKDYAQDQGAILKKQSDNEIKENNRVKNERKKIEEAKRDIIDATLQAGITASGLAVQALGEETTAGQVALAIKKTLALAEIAIGLEKQLAANAVAGAKISAEAPPVTIPLGIAYTVATDVLAVAGAAASAAKILGFNTGGIVPGVGNTDSVPAILTPGEIVMNKTASEQFAPVLSYLNTLAGGASFAPSIAPRMSGQVDGGLMARTLGNSAFPSAAEIGAAVAQNVPTSIGVDTINRANAQKARARAVTTLGARR